MAGRLPARPRPLRKQSGQPLHQCLERPCANRGTREEQQIPPRRNDVGVSPNDLADAALDAIALHRAPKLPPNDYADPPDRRTFLTKPDYG